MKSLRDIWPMRPLFVYFENLSPPDRATFLIVVALALAVALSVQKIFSHGIAIGDHRVRPIAPFDTRLADSSSPSRLEVRPC